MNMRFSKIDLEKLKNLSDQVIKRFNEEEKEYYLVIGNAALRTKSKNNKIAYLFGSESNIKAPSLMYPELHKQSEKFIFCECPDFYYMGKLEEKLCQAMSLEVGAKKAKKIKGLVITMGYDDLRTCRGSQYTELILKLGQLFNNNFEKLIKSSIFIITDVIKDIDKNDYIESLNSHLETRKEGLQNADDYLGTEYENEIKQAKMEIDFTKLIVSHPNQILLLDAYDQGESREAIFKALTELSPVELSEFNFETLYTDILKGFDFNIRMFIDDMLSKSESSCEFRKVV